MLTILPLLLLLPHTLSFLPPSKPSPFLSLPRLPLSLSSVVSSGTSPSYTWLETETSITITHKSNTSGRDIKLNKLKPGGVAFGDDGRGAVAEDTEGWCGGWNALDDGSTNGRNLLLLLSKNGGLKLSVDGEDVWGGVLKGEVEWDSVFWSREDGVVRVEMEKCDLQERWERVNVGGREGEGFEGR